jgi:hypothetical protein
MNKRHTNNGATLLPISEPLFKAEAPYFASCGKRDSVCIGVEEHAFRHAARMVQRDILIIFPALFQPAGLKKSRKQYQLGKFCEFLSRT